MADEERLIVALEARITEFEKRMKKAEGIGTRSYRSLRRNSNTATQAMERDMVRSTSAINRALAATSAKIGGLGKGMVAGLAVGAVTTAAVRVTRSLHEITQGIAEIGDEAKRSGLGTQAFQEWKFVAEQNRIGVDALVDGFKELNLRADEFVVTGAGPAAEAFKRIGYGADDLKRGLEDPSDLMLEIIGRMEDLDRAAQIRVADEIFGGTAGERFVELLSQGEGKLRQTVQRAHEVGAVMSDEVITRAEELDRKFGEITSRISTLGKTIVVNLAGAIDDVLTLNVDDIFGSAERAIAMMGQANYDAMKAGTDMAEDQVAAAEELFETYDALFRAIGAATGPDGIRLMDVADIDQAHDLAAILQEIDEEMAAFQNGATSAGTFEDAVSDLIGEAQDLIGELNTVDQARFGNVISAIGGIAQALATAATKATALRDELPAGGESVLHTGPTSRRGHREGSPPRSSPRPKARPATTIDMVYGSGGSSGGSSGGGGRGAAKASEYKAEADALREKTVALEAEAAALAAVALGGKKYADAVDFARKKAELLVAAQQDGREITPELSAEIDQLAEAYTRAGKEAGDAADKLTEIQERSERAADRMTDLFAGILSGAKSGKEAVADLLLEFARMQMHKGFLSLASGGTGIGSVIGSLFGFAGGGYTGSGRKYEPAGVVHKGEYVVQASQVRKPGVRSFLDAVNNGAGFSSGGYAVPPQMASAPLGKSSGGTSRVVVELAVPEGVTVGDVQQIAGNVAVEVVARNNRAVSQAQRRPR